MELSDDLRTNIPVVDDQHEKFLAALDKVQDALKTKLSYDEIQGYLNFFEVYAELHFSAEEYYMSLYEYPDSDSHKGEHCRFKDDIETLKKDVAQCNLNMSKSIQVSAFMMRWFIHHIRNCDKQFASFLQENGLEFKEGVPAQPS